MNRGYTVDEYTDFLDRARAILDQPESGRPLMLSGDFIVGFPTETDEDFAASVALVDRARYKNCFIFKYSPRPGTTAFDKLADDVPEAVKRRRNNALLAVQARICDEISREQVGREFDVLVEGLSRRETKRRQAVAGGGACATGGVQLTVSARQAVSTPKAVMEPVQLSGRTDGDQIVFFDVPGERAPESLVGSIVRVKIVSAGSLALHAECVGL